MIKESYNREIKLQCINCGSENHFETHEKDKHIECTNCGKIYSGGYDELVELNKPRIDAEIEQEIIGDIDDEISKMFKF